MLGRVKGAGGAGVEAKRGGRGRQVDASGGLMNVTRPSTSTWCSVTTPRPRQFIDTSMTPAPSGSTAVTHPTCPYPPEPCPPRGMAAMLFGCGVVDPVQPAAWAPADQSPASPSH